MQGNVDYEPWLPSTRLVSQVATAINDAYRARYNDSVSIVASIEMAEAALKVIGDHPA